MWESSEALASCAGEKLVKLYRQLCIWESSEALISCIGGKLVKLRSCVGGN